MAHILIVEPDKILAGTYAKALNHEGYTTAIAYGAQDAIQAADTARPDIIVLELQLAVHDGIEFLHELRSYAEWRQIPVVVQTAITPQDIEPVRLALQVDLGVVHVLYKPATSLQMLAGTLRETLRQAETA